MNFVGVNTKGRQHPPSTDRFLPKWNKYLFAACPARAAFAGEVGPPQGDCQLLRSSRQSRVGVSRLELLATRRVSRMVGQMSRRDRGHEAHVAERAARAGAVHDEAYVERRRYPNVGSVTKDLRMDSLSEASSSVERRELTRLDWKLGRQGDALPRIPARSDERRSLEAQAPLTRKRTQPGLARKRAADVEDSSALRLGAIRHAARL